MENLTIESAKQFLKDNGYFVDNLWSVEDVKCKYECSDEQAQTVLNDVLGGEWFMGEVNASIDITASDYSLRRKQSNYFLISGFWKDSKEKFSDYLVQQDDFEDDQEADDEAIFFYGLSEEDIEELIIEKWNSEYEFVITSYEETTLI
ncbi:MAG: hypothetical protein V4666_08035 [Bacteroidota bacterium]